MDRLRPVLGIIAIFFLLLGSYLGFINFVSAWLSWREPTGIPSENILFGSLGVGLILLGVIIFRWLMNGIIMPGAKQSSELKRPGTEKYHTRKQANERGVYLLLLLAAFVIGVLLDILFH